ncbi:M28 family metallopeptidase [Anaerolinea sp.]|uniref:M28 family metallopeptidase n=1 Tax=Anaerolinea sp. TaxID=1872519 RepID=UPI002618FF20|nr:M28 family metallopeptidase [uncultured Anaerolinea sp.]
MKLHQFACRLPVLILLTTILLLTGTAVPGHGYLPLQDLSLCTGSPLVSELLTHTGEEQWATWIRQFSGGETIELEGKFYRITTRFSSALFSNAPNARAYDYILQWLSFWYPEEWIEEHAFQFSGETWNNIILTIPGSKTPEEILLATAHLDSLSPDPLHLAPGAEDNASGVATLMEMARLFRHYRFARTIRLIWFTGEEQGLIGSKAYVRDYGTSGIVGVLNFDMFGYDRDGDRCFEIHTGTQPQSRTLGTCMERIISALNLHLETDLIDGYNMTFSDHASFWEAGVPALEVLENHFYNAPSLGCAGTRDQNPNYHTIRDTIDTLNLPVGFDIAQAGIAATASLAGIQTPCFTTTPEVQLQPLHGISRLTWTEMKNASQYRVLRANSGCHQTGHLISETPLLSWEDSESLLPFSGYMVEAVSSSGCVSFPSACVWNSFPFRQSHPTPTKR